MLAVNTVLKELDVSDNTYRRCDSAGFAEELAVGISDNGAMTRLNISNNQLCGHWKTPGFSGFKALAAAIEQHKLLTMDTVDMSEALVVSGQNLGTAGAKMMATFIKGNGALQCTDGTPYQSEKSFMMSTHVCRHCGQHKPQHTSR
jgi:hypothetical protein